MDRTSISKIRLTNNVKPWLAIIFGIPSIMLLMVLHSRPSFSTTSSNNNNNVIEDDDLNNSINNVKPLISSSLERLNNLIEELNTETITNNTKWMIYPIKNNIGNKFVDSRKFCICDTTIFSATTEPQNKSFLSSSHETRRHYYSVGISFEPNTPLYVNRTLIFLITPTYTRPTQMADMTRLAQTLRLVPDIFWIVVEDAHNKSKVVEELLFRSKIPFVHLLGPRPATHQDKRSGRGVSNRLKALSWLRENYLNTVQQGVIYFADDDNAYDIRIFDEMRDTKVVSMFPVGLIASIGLSTPIVNKTSGKIIGFHDPFIGRRKFAVDMAGFAVNLQLFLSKRKATMPYKVGYEEDYYLKSLGIKIGQLEPKADNCTKILVWHTKTKPADYPKPSILSKVTMYKTTNLPALYQEVLADAT